MQRASTCASSILWLLLMLAPGTWHTHRTKTELRNWARSPGTHGGSHPIRVSSAIRQRVFPSLGSHAALYAVLRFPASCYRKQFQHFLLFPHWALCWGQWSRSAECHPVWPASYSVIFMLKVMERTGKGWGFVLLGTFNGDINLDCLVKMSFTWCLHCKLLPPPLFGKNFHKRQWGSKNVLFS